MAEPARIGVVDDDAAQRQLLSSALERAGYATRTCKDGAEALEHLDEFAAMLLDVRMPGLSGLEVLRLAKQRRPDLPIILLTAFIDVRDAVSAIKMGAIDYLEKPIDLDELIAAVDDALGLARGVEERLRVRLPEGVVAESALMRSVFDLALRAAETDVTVLLLGESGVGKEVVADFIHRRSGRAAKPHVRVDCASLPKDIIESELFGHEKGSFTGADSARRGQFEAADGGTIFLDEIGELPAALQPKFLRVLETGQFRRVGGNAEIKTDVRVIAATNRDLAASAQPRPKFRQSGCPLQLFQPTAVTVHDTAKPVRVIVALNRRLPARAQRPIIDGVGRHSLGLGAPTVAVPDVQAASGRALPASCRVERPVARFDILSHAVVGVDEVFLF